MASVVYYNSGQIRKRIRDNGWASIPGHFRGTTDLELFESYELLSKFFEGVPFIDRTGTLQHYISVKNVCPMPTFDALDGHFEAQCERRAAEIAATGKEIVVFWSGGIDSTIALLSLILGGFSEQIKVVLTNMSILENPNFYRVWIDGKLNTTILNSEDVRQSYSIDENAALVTGELGDQLFGSMFIFRYTMNQLTTSWEDFLSPQLSEFIQPVIAKSPRPITTLFDFLWWTNFNLKWHNVKYRFVARSEHICKIDQLYHYFETPYFQNWSALTEQPKILNHHKTYKWAAKQYIHKHTADDDFLYNKLKVPSLRSNPGRSNPTFMLEDGKRVNL